MHLIGISKVRFHLLSGRFNDNFAAVYDDETTTKISGMPIDIYILAATAIRYSAGIMVLGSDKENLKLKAAILRAFKNNKDTKLIIAVDASKFIVPTERRIGVIPQTEWAELLEEEYDRIILITSKTRADTSLEQQTAIEFELSKFREQNILIEYGIDPTES